MGNIFQREPALISGLIAAAIILAVSFGVPIDETQKAAIMGFVGAVIAIAAALTTRSQVTPNVSVAATFVPDPAAPNSNIGPSISSPAGVKVVPAPPPQPPNSGSK